MPTFKLLRAVVNETLAPAVFTLLVQRISDGAIEDLKHVLPAYIADLWP